MRFTSVLKILSIAMCFTLIPLAQAHASGATIYVAPTGSVGTGASCASPGYIGGSSIASAVAAAVDGDTVILCNGTFFVTSQVFIDEKEITVSGESTAQNTIIEGAGSTNGIFKIISKKNVTIQNLTFYRGNSSQYGGAIYLSLTPSESLSTTRHLITNNIFAQNHAGEQGGAIWGSGDNMVTGDFRGILTISNNTFVENKAEVDAGAISMVAVTFDPTRVLVQSNKFLYNHATTRQGGAISSNFNFLTSVNNVYYMNTVGVPGNAASVYRGLKLSGDIFLNDLSAGKLDCSLEDLNPNVIAESFTDNPYCLLFDNNQTPGFTTITRAQGLALTGYLIPQSPLVSTHSSGLSSVTVTLAARGTGGTNITQYSYSLDGGAFANFPAGGSLTQSITGLTPATTYQIRIMGTNSVGTSYESAPYAVSTSALYNSSSRDGSVSCSVSGFFTIANNIVTGNTSCVGAVVIPSGVTSIAEDAFTANTSITSVDIPKTVHTIGVAAFYANTSLTTVTFQANSELTSIGSAAFERTAIASIALPSSLTFLGNYAFYRNTALTSITIPIGITQILQNTFESATALTSINLPITLTTIEGEVFKGTGLNSIIIPNGVMSIGTDAFTNTTALTTYTYCGTISNADLTAAGLGGKTKASCSPPFVYVAPTPVPYLKTLTTPKLKLKDGKLVCTPGTYNAGYTLNGVIQGSETALFTPSTFTYHLLINGVTQTSLALTSNNSSHSWSMPTGSTGALVTCSVTVTANGVTNTDKSGDNTSGASSALSAQSAAIALANATYSAALAAHTKAYQKAIVDNRPQWRSTTEKIRTDYYAERDRIRSLPSTKATRALSSAALKAYTAALKKSAADYKASGPAALAAKDVADKAALAARESAIAKANAAYGTAIESIGYGVLIP